MRGGERAYDLEDRTLEFARRVRVLVRGLPVTVSNREDARLLVRASGSGRAAPDFSTRTAL